MHKLTPIAIVGLLSLLLSAMLLPFTGASPAAATDGASEFNTQATVAVSNLDLSSVGRCRQGFDSGVISKFGRTLSYRHSFNRLQLLVALSQPKQS
jgi:hypothetical protein